MGTLTGLTGRCRGISKKGRMLMGVEDYSRDELVEFLTMALEERVLETDRTIDPGTPLEEAGLDSLRLTQLLLEIEEETGIWVDEQHLTPENLETVNSLAKCLEDVLADS
jgi:acyl carrier protein